MDPAEGLMIHIFNLISAAALLILATNRKMAIQHVDSQCFAVAYVIDTPADA